MPRYFFHVHDGQDIIDHEGTDLPSEAQAKSQAVVMSGRLIMEMGDEFWKSGQEWRLEVTNQTGTKLFELKFMAT